MNHIDKLIDIYESWITKDENKNVGNGSADEVYLYNDSLTEKQSNWLKRFIDVFEKADEIRMDRGN